jgi:hypothetical protein
VLQAKAVARRGVVLKTARRLRRRTFQRSDGTPHVAVVDFVDAKRYSDIDTVRWRYVMRETVTEKSLNSRGRSYGLFALLGDWRQCREDEHGKHAGRTKVVTCEWTLKLAIRSRPYKPCWLSLS